MRGVRTLSILVGEWQPGGPDLDAADVAAIRRGLACAAAIARVAHWPTVWLIARTTADVRPATPLSQALGESVTRALRRRRFARLGAHVQLAWATAATLVTAPLQGAILAVAPSAKTLARLNDLTRPNAVIVVPGPDPRDTQAWIDAWGPRDLVDPDRTWPARTIAEREVREFLRDFTTQRVGLDQPADIADARAICAALRQRAPAIEPRAIRAFIVRETAWTTANADKLATIAAGRRATP